MPTGVYRVSASQVYIEDIIYGKEFIKEKAMVDLILHPAVQRTKDLFQYGPPRNWWHRDGYSRFDHGVGVMLQLRRHGASVGEQVAGLLHDVSHRAFSHVYDWIVGRAKSEDAQDNGHEQRLRHLGLQSFLFDRGFDLSRVASIESYSLLDQPLPRLCADRLDYALRELATTQDDPVLARRLFEDVKVYNGSLAFSTPQCAKLFGLHFLGCQVEHWAGDQSVVRFQLLADAVKYAIEKGVFELRSMDTTDSQAAHDLKMAGLMLGECGDRTLIDRISMLENGFNIVHDPAQPVVVKKFRWVDPAVCLDGALVPLSQIDPVYGACIQSARESCARERRLKAVPLSSIPL